MYRLASDWFHKYIQALGDECKQSLGWDTPNMHQLDYVIMIVLDALELIWRQGISTNHADYTAI